jgi:hypothetical protein
MLDLLTERKLSGTRCIDLSGKAARLPSLNACFSLKRFIFYHKKYVCKKVLLLLRTRSLEQNATPSHFMARIAMGKKKRPISLVIAIPRISPAFGAGVRLQNTPSVARAAIQATKFLYALHA